MVTVPINKKHRASLIEEMLPLVKINRRIPSTLLVFERKISFATPSPVYILDQPEAALSPLRQLSMLSRIHQLVNQKSQFIIATHSPILMSYPSSKILELTDSGIKESSVEKNKSL